MTHHPGRLVAAVANGSAYLSSTNHSLRNVIVRHHILVRWTHWINVLLLTGLILSGFSIYWASPVYQHPPDPVNGSFDYLGDFGIWLCAHMPGLHSYPDPQNWFYNHISLGPGMLASALRLHWLFGYLFLFNGLVYLFGLVLGGGYRALLLRRGDLIDGLLIARYYLSLFLGRRFRRPWPQLRGDCKYNSLQRAAYLAIVVAGALVTFSGWAMHKPMQLRWLASLFGGYDLARAWHFWLMWFFMIFSIPHVILVLSDGWDTARSMVIGWSRTEIGGKDEGG